MAFDTAQDSYVRLRAIVSERTRPFVIWCGAGLSKPAGLPDWKGLRGRLISAGRRKAETLDVPAANTLKAELGRIESEPNPWVAFGRLEKSLGRTTFVESIREAIRPAAAAPIPDSYSNLWRLRPAGVMNLNLDRLATRAYHQVNAGKHIVEFAARNAGNLTHVLRGLHPFAYNMHGIDEDTSTWVLTHAHLQAMLSTPGYLNFVNSVLSTHVVIFIGLSADDVAVGGHLERLKSHGIETTAHYWLSSRADADTDRWAEDAGIQLVRYRNADGQHKELGELIEDLLTFVPPDVVSGLVPVVATVAGALPSLPPPADLARLDAETIRAGLNERAGEILLGDTQESFRAFEAFVRDYDEAVHRAWYVSLKDGQNRLFGYVLIEEIAKGAFGRVFKAQSADGTLVAIKILHATLRDEPDLLLAFRRGVRSMSILQNHGLTGVVKYLQASEIPATVVMEWVEGANLSDAVATKRLSAWPQILDVALQLAGIIGHAHALPERVLHRDLRPANIMLEGFWTQETWRVIVLDFDLSWHRGAYEHSVTYGSGTAGYLAPEQVAIHRDESARHAAVDSFGLGMTLYFMVSGVDPVLSQHRHSDWQKIVGSACNKLPRTEWHSLPSRFARLIISATMNRQAERLDVAQIIAELARLRAVITNPDQIDAVDLLAEEVAARVPSLEGYVWNEDELTAQLTRPTGLECRVTGEEGGSQISVSLSWNDHGNNEWRRVQKWLPGAADAAAVALKKAGWVCEEPALRDRGFALRAVVDGASVMTRMRGLTAGVQQALSHMTFR